MTLVHTSTNALNLLSSFEVMWRASAWKGEFSPTIIRDRHFSFLSPSVMSGLLQNKTSKVKVVSKCIQLPFRVVTITENSWQCSYETKEGNIQDFRSDPPDFWTQWPHFIPYKKWPNICKASLNFSFHLTWTNKLAWRRMLPVNSFKEL